MKNLNLIIALLVCLALPAATFGQGVEVSCDACTHEVSVFMGEGGFVATADYAEDAEDDDKMVTWVQSCEGTTTSGELEANDDGLVSGLFACDGDSEGNQFRLGPITDGGWYWITDADNSAVGNLVAMDILKNDPTEITDAGEGVSMDEGNGAVLLKEASSGRIGILPTILPEPPPAAAVLCGPRMAPSFPNAYDRQANSGCMLGAGRTKIRLTGPGAHGTTAHITNGMVYRPVTGSITVGADLWVDEMGSFTTVASDATNYVTAVQKGWAGKTASALGAGSGTNWLSATFSASVAGVVGNPTPVGSTPVAGVTLTNDGSTGIDPGTGTANPIGQAVFTIEPDTDYCSRNANHTALVHIAATPRADDGTPEADNNIHPPIAVGNAAGLGRSAAFSAFAQIAPLRVVCPPASANLGEELVPENPFPPTD